MPSIDKGIKAVMAPGLVAIYAVAESSRFSRVIRIAMRPPAHTSINDDKMTGRAICLSVLSYCRMKC